MQRQSIKGRWGWSIFDVPPLLPLGFVLLEGERRGRVQFQDCADDLKKGEGLVESTRGFGFYVAGHYVLQVLFLDLVAVLSFLGLFWNLEGWLTVELGVVGRCVEVVREDEVLQFLEGALANQFVFFILFALELLELGQLLLQLLIFLPLYCQLRLFVLQQPLQFVSFAHEGLHLLPQRQKLISLSHYLLLLLLSLRVELLCDLFFPYVVEMMLQFQLLFAHLGQLVIFQLKTASEFVQFVALVLCQSLELLEFFQVAAHLFAGLFLYLLYLCLELCHQFSIFFLHCSLQLVFLVIFPLIEE